MWFQRKIIVTLNEVKGLSDEGHIAYSIVRPFTSLRSVQGDNGEHSEKDLRMGIEDEEMRTEYDFKQLRGGARGKYFKAHRAGHTVKIHRADGTTEVHFFRLEDGAVMLEPDVRAHFPNAEAVNAVLRSLMPG